MKTLKIAAAIAFGAVALLAGLVYWFAQKSESDANKNRTAPARAARLENLKKQTEQPDEKETETPL
jgi:hypothetical protein